MKRVRIGIVGCGEIAFKKHLPNLVKHERVSLDAFHNRTRSKAVQAKKQFGSANARVYDTADALLEDPSIDAVHVLTANDTHHDFAIRALANKKHVMVEKPMARNESEARSMLDAAKHNDCFLTVAYQNRFRADIRRLKSMIEEGELGEIYHIKAKSIRRRGTPSWGTFTDKTIQGGGPLIDIGSHVLDLSLHLLGFPTIAYVAGAHYTKLSHENKVNKFGPFDHATYDVEDSAFAFIKTTDKTTINLECSYALNTTDEGENILEVHGTKAGATIHDGLTLNYVSDEGYVSETIELPHADAAKWETDAWIESILKYEAPFVKAQEGYEINRIIDAIYRSAHTNKPVSFK